MVIAFFGVLYLVLSYLRSRAETRDSAWPSTKFTAGLIASMAFGLAGYLWTIVVTAYHLPPAIGESMIACGTAFYARQAKDTWEDASDNKQRRPREIAKDTIRDLPKDILDAAGNSIRENIL